MSDAHTAHISVACSFNIRVFVGGANPSYSIVAQMQPFFPPSIDPSSGARWYPTLCTMVDGTVLIVSGQTQEGRPLADNRRLTCFSTTERQACLSTTFVWKAGMKQQVDKWLHPCRPEVVL